MPCYKCDCHPDTTDKKADVDEVDQVSQASLNCKPGTKYKSWSWPRPPLDCATDGHPECDSAPQSARSNTNHRSAATPDTEDSQICKGYKVRRSPSPKASSKPGVKLRCRRIRKPKPLNQDPEEEEPCLPPVEVGNVGEFVENSFFRGVSLAVVLLSLPSVWAGWEYFFKA